MTHYKTSLNKLAEHTNSKLVGDGSAIVDSISTIQNAQSGSITFLSNNFTKRLFSKIEKIREFLCIYKYFATHSA